MCRKGGVFTMKLYQYDELKKLNQALGSFKRNGVPVEKLELITVENKVVFFVLTDPALEEKSDIEGETVETPKEEKVKSKSQEKREKILKDAKKEDNPSK